jgi:hypothetical protein
LILVIAASFGIPRLFPQIFYKNHIQYKDYKVYSNNIIDRNIYQILDSSAIIIGNNLIDKKQDSYNVFLCNSYFLFWIHTFLGKLPVAASDLITNNIYIANVNLTKNYASNSKNLNGSKGRSVQSAIAHEQTHIILRQKLGFWKYRQLLKEANWKIEGFCEWIAFNGEPFDYNEIYSIIASGIYVKSPFCRYKIFRFVVNYLIVNKKYDFNDLIDSKDEFEYILQELINKTPNKYNITHY